MSLKTRKLQHIKIVQEENVEPNSSAFSKFGLPYKTLPEINLKDVSTKSSLFGYNLTFPFLIASMTGGAKKASVINKNLAIAAEEYGVGLGLGSMRIILKDKAALPSFKVKKYCPSIPLFANLGLVQLNYGVGLDDINYLIESIDADGIFLHVNALQEAIQPEGDTNFHGLVEKLGEIINKISKPIVVKEVGCGFDVESAKLLKSIGVKYIDVAGTGGTSWPLVESYRRDDNLGFVFGDTGIDTASSVQVCSSLPGLKIVASGGIRSGKDIAIAHMLGADFTSTAKPLLNSALESPEEIINILESYHKQLKIAMFASGVNNIKSLKKLTPTLLT